MASPELLIKIGADAKNAIKAFDDVKAKTQDLQDVLNKASLAGAAVFAALSAEVFLSVKAFGEAEAASNALSQSLQNQGIYTANLKGEYKSFADEISRKTGIDDDQITKAQAIAQGYLGQTKITKELTQAIVDFSTKTGDLNSAATAIGKTIGSNTNALARETVKFREGATEAEKYAEVLKKIGGQYGGQAEAANAASFGINNLKTAFGNLQENIGSRFAPAVKLAADAITNLINKVNSSQFLQDMIVGFIAVTGAIAAAVAGIAPFFAGYTALSAAAVAFGTSIGALLVPLGAVALAIGAVVYAGVSLYRNWDALTLFMGSAFSAMGVLITEVAGGIAQVFNAGFDVTKIAAGIQRVNEAGKKAGEEFTKTYREESEKRGAIAAAETQKQVSEKKKAADDETREKRAQEAREAATRRANEQLKILQYTQASKEYIALKSEEAAILKTLETEKNAAVIQAAKERLAEVRALEDEQAIADMDRAVQFEAQKRELLAELAAENPDLNTEDPKLQAELDSLRTTLQLQQDVENQYAKDKLQNKIKADNDYLLQQKKFGTAYAAVNKLLSSDEVKAAAELSGELVGLANSKNSTLKAIGKAAAISQIAIATATSAAKVFADAVILLGPFAGPPVGGVLAAARIAYGAEQIANVTAAAGGAMVGDGQQPSRGDRYPYMLEYGETVAPRRNFDEVVNGVQTERSGVIKELQEGIAELRNRGAAALNITIQGDFVGDETYAQRMGRAISNEIKYGNLEFAGVS